MSPRWRPSSCSWPWIPTPPRNCATGPFFSPACIATTARSPILKHTCGACPTPVTATISAAPCSICARLAGCNAEGSTRMTEFERRRAAFSKAIGDAVAVFPAAPGAVRSNDSAYPYRADSDLYYLTGFTEPDCVLVLAPSHPETKSITFVQHSVRELEVWTGHRLGVKQAQKTLGVDIALPMTELLDRLPKLVFASDTLYYALGGNERFNRRIVEHVRTARFAGRPA